ncbi:MAG: C25 family cysteine peptidase, partial [candidate division WOR-3 bacterium]|nr:C25 family cysteine peptidase [candidate division WOR-3 bacterium]
MKRKLSILSMREQGSYMILLLMAILGSGAFAQEARTMVQYSSELPTIDTLSIPIAERGPWRVFNRITVPGFHNYGDAGEPVLPYKTARILLPPGHEVESIRVILGEEISLEGEYYLEPGQRPIPTSVDTFIYTPPNRTIYESENPFPETLYRVISTQNFRGYKIVLIQLCPIKYIPARRKIFYYPNINVTIETKKVRDENPFYRGLPRDREAVESMIDNPEILKQYPELDESHLKHNPLPEGKWDMIIITDTTLKSVFNNYATWRTTHRGIRTIVYDIATILANYSGYDNAEKVRNFIIDAYNDWGIQYALLGGDVDIVPHRLLRSELWGGENIPADIYYAGLDGTWDTDGDHIYGETTPADEADLFAEVYVGRAPVNTVTEAQNFCDKIRSYEESGLDTVRCDWLFFSTILSSSGQTYGGVYKDDTETKELHPPHGFNITKVYQYLGGTSAQVISALNAGQRVGNSCGHGHTGGFGMLTSTNVDNLTNTHYCLIYTWACWTNAFDQTTDCIGEHFLYTKHGAFAYIGNSRYGWYQNSGDASGPSHDFE